MLDRGFLPIGIDFQEQSEQNLPDMLPPPLPIFYSLIIQCVRPHIGVVAEFSSGTPFPPLIHGGHLELLDCDPVTWDIFDSTTRILKERTAIFITTLVLVDSPVLDNSDRRPPEED